MQKDHHQVYQIACKTNLKSEYLPQYQDIEHSKKEGVFQFKASICGTILIGKLKHLSPFEFQDICKSPIP